MTTTLPPALQTAFSQVAAGDVAGAVTTLNNALTEAALGVALPLAPIFSIPSQMAQHVLNVANVFSGLPVTLGLSVLSTVEGTFFQVGTSVQTVVDAVRAGDGVTALSGLLNGPAEIAGAFLNGVPSQGFVGVLSQSLGLLNVLAVQIPEQIAQALAPAPATTTLAKLTALKAPTAVPSLAPKMVTLPTAVDTKTTATTTDGTAATTADDTAATAASNAGSLKTKGDDTKGAAGADGARHAKGTRGADGARHAKRGGGHEGKSGGGHEGKSGGRHESKSGSHHE